MKKLILYIIPIALLFSACGQGKKTELRGPQTIKGLVFGDSVLDNNIRNVDALYAIMQKNPTMKLKVKGVVDDVCKEKGCWLTMKLPNGEIMRVTFKNYSFSVPQAIKGKEIVVDGEAKVDSISVADQRHYAKDSGLSKEDIDKITTVKKVLTFEAKGAVAL
ncbi:MAG: DUF4920 domain-containing protein [Sphingobacteriales bacterium]|nr:DUF4920 domain-containing protein [Sphingobacteriales bacterium]